jgi:hypothetical protein
MVLRHSSFGCVLRHQQQYLDPSGRRLIPAFAEYMQPAKIKLHWSPATMTSFRPPESGSTPETHASPDSKHRSCTSRIIASRPGTQQLKGSASSYGLYRVFAVARVHILSLFNAVGSGNRPHNLVCSPERRLAAGPPVDMIRSVDLQGCVLLLTTRTIKKAERGGWIACHPDRLDQSHMMVYSHHRCHQKPSAQD